MHLGHFCGWLRPGQVTELAWLGLVARVGDRGGTHGSTVVRAPRKWGEAILGSGEDGAHQRWASHGGAC
jgi:hypothetical protein